MSVCRSGTQAIDTTAGIWVGNRRNVFCVLVVVTCLQVENAL